MQYVYVNLSKQPTLFMTLVDVSIIGLVMMFTPPRSHSKILIILVALLNSTIIAHKYFSITYSTMIYKYSIINGIAPTFIVYYPFDIYLTVKKIRIELLELFVISPLRVIY